MVGGRADRRLRGVMGRSTVGAACSQASNAALSVLVMKRQLPPGRKAALAVVALGTGMRSLDYLRAEGESGGNTSAARCPDLT